MATGQEDSESEGTEPLQVSLLATLPRERGELLSRGRSALKSATDHRGWRQPKLPEPQDCSHQLANCYRYHFRPPTILGSRLQPQIPLWNSHLANEIPIHPRQLDAFNPNLVMNPQPPDIQSDSEIEWFTLIPKPHSLSFPQTPQRPSRGLDTVKPFRSSYVFNETACDYVLNDPFARVSWWIPIEGSLYRLFPSTSIPSILSWARFLAFHEDRSSQMGITPPNDHIERNITWTPASAEFLWKFLITVREAGNFGPIALSYNIKSKSCVYITVGCDAPAATRLRSSLAAWKAPEGQDLRGINDKYYLRLLRPSRLLLVDDTGAPLLIA